MAVIPNPEHDWMVIPNQSPISRNPPLKSGFPSFFFLDGNLYQTYYRDRGRDTIYVEKIEGRERVMLGLSLTDVKRRMERAFTTAEAAALMNRTYQWLRIQLHEGNIEKPHTVYRRNDNPNPRGWDTKGIQLYRWSEEDLKRLHDSILDKTHTWGKQRKDGLPKRISVPPWRLIKAWIREEEVLYVMRGGEAVPTFIAEQF